MCGITGFWTPSGHLNHGESQDLVNNMARQLLHRGPDEGGSWVDAEAGIALGHRRLVVLDAQQEGPQPMLSADGRYVLVLDGEIYNAPALRRELTQLGHQFRGQSDPEVMLASFSQWGLEKALQRSNGMFALALWDRQERVLHLGRDRLGEKPLYYGWQQNTLLFGSELKALRAYPKFQAEIDRDALTIFFRYNYIPAPHAIYKGIYKLLPGTTLSWNGTERQPNPVAYWSTKTVVQQAATNPFEGSEIEAEQQLETLLRDAIGRRMQSGAALGSFLSGGLDSSTIAALMQAQSSQPIKTFTIGFLENDCNEAPYAKAVAQHLGTEHTELFLTPKEAQAIIPRLSSLYDEPFSDSSQIPTFLAAQLASQSVKVSFSGDGGDETMFGYDSRFAWCKKIWRSLGWAPLSLRKPIAQIVNALSYDHKLDTPAAILAIPSPEALYIRLFSHWKTPETIVINDSHPPAWLATAHTITYGNPQLWLALPTLIQTLLYMDTMTYLPNNLLVKVDRATAGASLKNHEPFLDPNLFEFAWKLPLHLKIHQGQDKWLLRRVLYKYVPQALVERPKQGFGIPIHRWLRKPLREWAEALLSEDRLKREGFLNPNPIRQKWDALLDNKVDSGRYLWDVLMFQQWLEANHS